MGSDPCQDCSAGKYSVQVGATTCVDCVAGKYSTSDGNDAEEDCQDCVAGTYSGRVGAEICESCVAGKYSVQVGATEAATCIDCISGKYSKSDVNDAEKDCLPIDKTDANDDADSSVPQKNAFAPVSRKVRLMVSGTEVDDEFLKSFMSAVASLAGVPSERVHVELDTAHMSNGRSESCQ